ncbi:MAG: AAA family ATPase [Chloroflexota bacterium]
MMPKFLPTSTSTFSDIITGGFLYIDKTKHVYDLVKRPKGVWFLSRPRRFGKSLFVSTLEELFRGNRALFKDFMRAKTKQ